MIIYGVALLAFCYLVGQLLGDWLGKLLHIDANIGGVGFAMLLLLIMNSWLEKKGWLDDFSKSGIQFWNQMYIPIIVAMAATQNVRAALSSGLIAVLAGLVPVAICYVLIPYLSNRFQSKVS